MEMGAAFYLDPARSLMHVPDVPHNHSAIGFWRLLDCDLAALEQMNFPSSDFTIAEIHAAQLSGLLQNFDRLFDRLSVVVKNMTDLDFVQIGTLIQDKQIDITLFWDHRRNLAYYLAFLKRAIQCGVQHISLYGLRDFVQWKKVQDFLQQHDFIFYDRFHASLPRCESPYQKHLARYGDVYAWGGWSRVTDSDDVTFIRPARSKKWTALSDHDRNIERLLFAMTDRDGIAPDQWNGVISADRIAAICAAGLAVTHQGRLCPTDQGLWHNVTLASGLLE